jgi:hypothetical protein
MSLGPKEQVALAALRKVRRESKARTRIGLGPGLAKFTSDRESLVEAIAALETRANKCGMYITGRGLNRAKNAWGWEIQNNTNMAACAIDGLRLEEKARKVRPDPKSNRD